MGAFDALKKHVDLTNKGVDEDKVGALVAEALNLEKHPAPPMPPTEEASATKNPRQAESLTEHIERTTSEPSEPTTNFPDLAKELAAQTSVNRVKPSTTFCGIVGHSGRGKTGISMDSFMHNSGPTDMMWCIDFDGGALDCKHAHYPDSDDKIRIWNPWETQAHDRVAFNYPKTHQRTMNLCKFALEQARKQQAPDYEGPRLTTLLVTAVDQYDQVCINNMKIYDLEMDAKDAIEAAASKLNQDIGWNWNIRTTRFKQLTALCRQLNFAGVDVFWETHIKSDDKEYSHDGWKFVWEKNANNDLTQIIWCKDQKIRNEDGKETGETRYMADFVKCKTNPDLQGQERVFFVTKKGLPATWMGLAELRDKTL